MVPSVRPEESKLTVYNIDDFVAAIFAKLGRNCSGVIIDLGDLEFIDLFAMTTVAFLCGDLEQREVDVGVKVSEDGACGFLQRAGFFDVLPSSVVLKADLPPARLDYIRAFRGANPALLEFTDIEDSETIRSILADFRRVLRYRLRYSVNEAKTLAIMLSELCHNVLDHNPAPARGVVAMQVHADGSRRFMQLIVGDRGLGIRQTLTRHANHADLTSDLDAIERSVGLGVSEFADPTHGSGLYHLLRLAHQHKGSVHIRSGTGKVYFRADRPSGRRFRVSPVNGTQFSIVFPTKVAQEFDTGPRLS